MTCAMMTCERLQGQQHASPHAQPHYGAISTCSLAKLDPGLALHASYVLQVMGRGSRLSLRNTHVQAKGELGPSRTLYLLHASGQGSRLGLQDVEVLLAARGPVKPACSAQQEMNLSVVMGLARGSTLAARNTHVRVLPSPATAPAPAAAGKAAAQACAADAAVIATAADPLVMGVHADFGSVTLDGCTLCGVYTALALLGGSALVRNCEYDVRAAPVGTVHCCRGRECSNSCIPWLLQLPGVPSFPVPRLPAAASHDTNTHTPSTGTFQGVFSVLRPGGYGPMHLPHGIQLVAGSTVRVLGCEISGFLDGVIASGEQVGPGRGTCMLVLHLHLVSSKASNWNGTGAVQCANTCALKQLPALRIWRP